MIKNAFYEPETRPKTVNKILPNVKRAASETSKLALVCFDGMGAAEWALLKAHLTGDAFQFSERFLFALIPTTTKISRSAIFHGDCVSVYSLNASDEYAAFSKHFPNKTCRFFREGGLQSEDDLLGIDVVVIIYNFFDDIAHETRLPPGDRDKFIYFKNLDAYLHRSPVKDELILLKRLGFPIRFCSDHGCVVAQGNGQRIDKYLIESASKRATLISKSDLARFYDVNQYQIPFIDDHKIALLSKNRTVFANKSYVGISHGGVTLEELVVPFVEVAP